MSYSSWDKVVAILNTAIQPLTETQIKLARIAEVTIPDDTPSVVASAILRVALSEELFLSRTQPVKQWCKDLLENLSGSTEIGLKSQNQEEALAWLNFYRISGRINQLTLLRISAGDVVTLRDGDLAEVSSIGEDGKVYFKGGKGHYSWPDMIDSVAVRNGDLGKNAQNLRAQADNAAAKRNSTPEWSAARQADLKEFLVDRQTTHDDIDELEKVIAVSNDEKPIQKFLDENMHLLTTLLGGKERYCMSQKRLGSEYIPDFLIADVDSMGVRWILVELETPKSSIYLKDASTLDKFTRKGIDQIVDWRDWLTSNLGQAHRPRRMSGLGLFDIGSHSEGLVLVGRRNRFPAVTKDSKRRNAREKQNINIHTYDWLTEQLRGAIDHQGPPRFNPFLLHKDEGISESRPR